MASQISDPPATCCSIAEFTYQEAKLRQTVRNGRAWRSQYSAPEELERYVEEQLPVSMSTQLYKWDILRCCSLRAA